MRVISANGMIDIPYDHFFFHVGRMAGKGKNGEDLYGIFAKESTFQVAGIGWCEVDGASVGLNMGFFHTQGEAVAELEAIRENYEDLNNGAPAYFYQVKGEL